MLFVEHDGAERRKRQKKCGTRAYDDAGVPACGKASEGALALLLALVAVIEEYGRAGEALCGVAPELEGNGHFRRENKG